MDINTLLLAIVIVMITMFVMVKATFAFSVFVLKTLGKTLMALGQNLPPAIPPHGQHKYENKNYEHQGYEYKGYQLRTTPHHHHDNDLKHINTENRQIYKKHTATKSVERMRKLGSVSVKRTRKDLS